MIAKLVVLAGFAWLLQLLGVPLWVLSMEKGGSVGYAKGGEVKEYQAGDGTDL